MPWTQISGIADRIILVFLTFMASRGWIPVGEVANYAALVLAVLGAFWGWWVNRPKALVEAAAAVPNPASPTGKTIVITSPELAAATPASSTVVSSATTKAVDK